ncbi:MAG: hypothetical protein ACKOSR_04055, partial [Flavobacteriales bacterium]
MFKHLLVGGFLFFLSLFSSELRAQSVLGGNITWNCTGGNQYTVALNLYVDCYGLATSTSAFPASSDIFFYPDASCTAPEFSAFSVSADSTVMVEISDLCPTELPNSSCNNAASANLGIKKITYEGQVSLAPGCSWTA